MAKPKSQENSITYRLILKDSAGHGVMLELAEGLKDIKVGSLEQLKTLMQAEYDKEAAAAKAEEERLEKERLAQEEAAKKKAEEEAANKS